MQGSIGRRLMHVSNGDVGRGGACAGSRERRQFARPRGAGQASLEREVGAAPGGRSGVAASDAAAEVRLLLSPTPGGDGGAQALACTGRRPRAETPPRTVNACAGLGGLGSRPANLDPVRWDEGLAAPSAEKRGGAASFRREAGRRGIPPAAGPPEGAWDATGVWRWEVGGGQELQGVTVRGIVGGVGVGWGGENAGRRWVWLR
jgi:hypothetical protein